jgi:hypothetical protein
LYVFKHKLGANVEIELIPEETSLVLAGSLNPAILTPQWVFKQAGLEDLGDRAVRAFLGVGVGGMIAQPKYELEGFSYTASSSNVVLAPTATDEGGLELIEKVALGILRALPHTPLIGVGHNFSFRINDPDPEMLRNIDNGSTDFLGPEEFHQASRSKSVSMNYEVGEEGYSLTLTKLFQDNVVLVKFNFHYEFAIATAAAAAFEGPDLHLMWKNFQTAKAFMANMISRDGE